MIFEETALILASDVEDSATAASVLAANPTIFDSINRVPLWTHTPLLDIWVPTAAASGELYERIVWKHGTGLEESRGDITIEGESMESVRLRDGARSNAPGAETVFIDLIFRMPEETEDFDQLVNAEMRVRHFIDATRRARRRLPVLFASQTANCVGFIRYDWWGFVSLPNVDETVSRYVVTYCTPAVQ